MTGRSALRKGRDEIKQLGKSAKKSFPTADDLSKFLRDIDDPDRAVEVDARAARDSGRKAPTGYTGMEGLLNYLYYQTLAINQYDEVGHLLHFSIFEVATGPCANYNAGRLPRTRSGSPTPTAPPRPPTSARRTAASPGSATSQPDINEPLNLPPYDPSVCPDGSTDTSLCDPAGTTAAAVDTQGGSEDSGPAPVVRRPRRRRRPGQPRPAAPRAGGRATPTRRRPDGPRRRRRAAPDRCSATCLGRRPARRHRAAAAGNSDLLGYLFGN